MACGILPRRRERKRLRRRLTRAVLQRTARRIHQRIHRAAQGFRRLFQFARRKRFGSRQDVYKRQGMGLSEG